MFFVEDARAAGDNHKDDKADAGVLKQMQSINIKNIIVSYSNTTAHEFINEYT